MQQDSKIMRVVMRAGFQVANPASALGDATRYPALDRGTVRTFVGTWREMGLRPGRFEN